MFSAGSQRKLWVLFCVQNKQKAQHCLLCIIPLLPLWIYKCSMITEIAVLRGPSALGTWFPALSGTSGVIIYWHHLLLTLGLQGSAKACEPAPLSPIPEYFHSIHLCLDTECLNTVAGVFPRHTGCFAQSFAQSEPPPTGVNSMATKEDEQWLHDVLQKMDGREREYGFVSCASGPCSSVAWHCCICSPVFTNRIKSSL